MVILAGFLFVFGIFGCVVNHKNFLYQLFFINIMLLGAIVNFVYFSSFKSMPSFGQMFAFIVLFVAVLEFLFGIVIIKYHSKKIKNFNKKGLC